MQANQRKMCLEGPAQGPPKQEKEFSIVVVDQGRGQILQDATA